MTDLKDNTRNAGSDALAGKSIEELRTAIYVQLPYSKELIMAAILEFDELARLYRAEVEARKAAEKEAERLDWIIPLLFAEGIAGDSRAILLALEISKGKRGREAIDAAIEQSKTGVAKD